MSESLPRNAFDEGVTFEQSGPNRGKITSLAHQLGALTRQIACSFPFDIFRIFRSILEPIAERLA